MTDIHAVLLPDHFGVTLIVCDPDQLTIALEGGQSLEDAITASAFDEIDPSDMLALVRVYQLNQTGDARAYWDRS